ncbi:unnamed protein product [Equus caballus papillomavirus 3]|uniref:Minor capsid protein L2 n=1 Tax=Equus caballus papillomavirus 3 TaxID=940834 RepID=E7C0H5_9PAPI|nr:unnamed protein product [Equus caballus papillomavirus 3]ADV03086.1 putative L2 late protein [Equus caballus papillomavirus 3]
MTSGRRKRRAADTTDTPPRKRRPRAAVEDIYRGCKPFNTCPEDVVNRVENKTWADRLLQWLGSVIYLGGLGIGSGRGTGGGTGYRPLGSTNRGVVVGGGSRAVRPPPLVVDTIGPVDAEVLEMIPLQPLEPGGPSVVSGSDGGVLVSEGGSLPPEIPGVLDGGGPEDSIPARDPAVLQVGEGDTGNSHVITPAIERPGFSGSSRDSFYIVDSGSRGSVVGEDIELVDLPRASTPETTGDALTRGLGSRKYQQVYVENPAFVYNPTELVAFGDTWDGATDSFSYDPVVASPQAAPDELFTDIVHLGRQMYERGREGLLRVGRVGRRGTIQTRAGTQIGPQVHFFHDLSPILPVQEEVELTTFPRAPEFESTNSEETAFTEVDLQSEPSSYSDTYLVEDDSVSVTGHLVFSDEGGSLTDNVHPINVPLRGSAGVGLLSVQGTTDNLTSNSLTPALQPPQPGGGDREVVVNMYPYSIMSFLHYRRRRKRGYVYFSDVILAI